MVNQFFQCEYLAEAWHGESEIGAMTGENEPGMATVAERERLQRMLEDPKFRAAWDSFNEELVKAAALVRQGAQPLGHATRAAAQRVLEAGDKLPD